AEREGRVVIEEERRRVVVEAEEEHVGLFLREPLRHRLVALEERLPVRILVLALVVRDADRRDVRGADTADDSRHTAGFYSGHPVLELADLLDPELDRLARAQEALARHADAR